MTNSAPTEAALPPLDESTMLALLEEHLGLASRRDSTVIDNRTGRWTDSARYFALMTAAILADRAARALTQGEPAGWRSMDSAPKNMRLLACVEGEVRVIRWGKTSHVPMHGFCLADQGPEDFDPCKPDCWMHFPAPQGTAA